MIERAAIQALADEIASKFDVERIILFGSYAYGTPTADSDVDLLVVAEMDGTWHEKSMRVHRAITRDVYCDVHVLSRGEVERRYAGFDPVCRHAIDQGRTLHVGRVATVGRES